MYNKQWFIDSMNSARIREEIKFCWQQKDWFSYDKLFNFSIKKAKLAHHKLGRLESKGRPSKTKNSIRCLIEMNFLLIDPVKGLKVNPDFIPNNQKELLKKV